MKLIDENEIIQERIQELKSIGASSPFIIAPIIHKRCFVPCKAGRCGCDPITDKGYLKDFVIISKDYQKQHLEDLNNGINHINERHKKILGEI